MKVFQVMAGAPEGGAETFFADLVPALHRAGLEQKVATRPAVERLNILRTAGIESIELPFGGFLDIHTRLRLRRVIQEWRPDVVQTWMNRATRHVPSGSFVHVGWLGGYYDPKYFRSCDHVVGVTPDIVRYLREDGAWPIDRSHYIPTFAPRKEAVPVERNDLGTPTNAPLIVALGRLHTKKAFDILLHALAQLPGVWLWLAGDGPLREELHNLAVLLKVDDRVRFLGWREDRISLLEAADVVVMPSRYEPFGTVMIEAWAARKPLVAAAADGPLGLVRDEEDALLVPINDVPELAGAVRKILYHPELANRLAIAGHAVWKKQFTETVISKQYMDFYAHVGVRA